MNLKPSFYMLVAMIVGFGSPTFGAGGGGVQSDPGAMEGKHFHPKGKAKNADLTVTLNRSDLETVMGGKTTFDQLITAGKAKFEGNRKPFDQLRGTLVQFKPNFELMPGTKPAKVPPPPAARDPFEVRATDTKGIP